MTTPEKDGMNTKFANAIEAWNTAMQAREAEMTRCLRDRAVWRDQAAVVLLGALKIFCVFLVVRMLCLMMSLSGEISTIIGLLLIPWAVLFNPRFFMKNLFADRADAAFDAEIKRRRQK